MRAMDFDPRVTALGIARARVCLGLAMVLAPSIAARVAFGGNTRQARSLIRMLGVRDVVLGVGAITAVKEQTQDAEWVGMGAVSDGVDTVAILLGPGPLYRRLVNASTAASSAATGMLCARQIADERRALAASEVDR
jgi:hypothetical protein